MFAIGFAIVIAPFAVGLPGKAAAGERSLGRLVDERIVTVFPQPVSGDPPLPARSAAAMLES